jgi:hypothetical protein
LLTFLQTFASILKQLPWLCSPAMKNRLKKQVLSLQTIVQRSKICVAETTHPIHIASQSGDGTLLSE